MKVATETIDDSVESKVITSAISYAEDQAMAGAYFPEWQKCADLLRAMCVHRGIPLTASPRPQERM